MANQYLDELSSLMWDALVSVLEGEMNVGPTGIGSGSNPDGRLQTLFFVHESLDLWSNDLPSCGIQLVKVECDEKYSQHNDWVKCRFKILVAAKANKDPETGLVVLDDAMRRVRAIVADGKGNGIVPILRDKANFRLNGTAAESHVDGWEYAWEFPDKTDTDARAYATIHYSAAGQAAKNQ
jgi:hypothetical protein